MRLGMIFATLSVWVVCTPQRAHACGGFFCSSQPVDQAGETIVYGLEGDGTITMSVQIRYQGMDDDFAWILPVPAPPSEIALGTDALFDALLAATEPMFVVTDSVEGTCRRYPACVYPDTGCAPSGGGGCGGDTSDRPWTGGYVDAAASDGAPGWDSGARGPGLTIFSERIVGPYETVVLGAASAMEVVTWLRDHSYDIPLETVPLLEPYAGAGQVFVALRLSANRVTGVLRPIELRIPTAEVCLPIRLTAIATVPDMPITAFFLGHEGVSPANYPTAVIDTQDPAFFTGGSTWEGAVNRAVDDLGGRAFATDYAGPTPLVRVTLPPIDDLAGADPAHFIQELSNRGYSGDALMLDLLTAFLVPPATWDPQDYYNCLATRSAGPCGEPSRWDPAGLVAQIQAEINEPRERAQQLVLRHGYLTRLYTEMSAEEMTVDPVFVSEPRLPETSNVHRAVRVTTCSAEYHEDGAPQHWEIGTEQFAIRSGSPAPDDQTYCARSGMVVAGSPEVRSRCGGERESGSCLCTVVGTTTIQGPVLLTVLLTFLMRRRRRQRRIADGEPQH